MLIVNVPGGELWNESKQEFIQTKPIRLQMEHSLVSISKWEAKWRVPFLDDKFEPTPEQTLDYVKCMTITQNVPDEVFLALPPKVMLEISEYIKSPMSATTFYDEKTEKAGKKEIVTSELIYYWMVALQIPMECEKWHIHRLLNLIKICNIKNNPDKKMSKKETMARNRAINEANKARFHSKG